MLAAYSNDILKFGLKAAGIENSANSYMDIKRGVFVLFPGNMPWSHGLFMSVVWSLLAAGIAYLFFHNRRVSSIFGLVVISHWLLDYLVHPPQLPLLFNQSPKVGLGLWITPTGFIIASILEVFMVLAGFTIYLNHNMNRYYRSE